MTRRAVVTATGRYLPEREVPNSWFCDELGLETSDAWIQSRTGVQTRRFVDREAGEATASMATEAARRCLAQAGLTAGDVDGILVATVTPDHFFPSTACLVQDALGAKGAFGWDTSAACSGFLFTLAQGAAMVRSGMANRLLVIGADTMSSILDFGDRATCVIFGDGAGCFLVEGRDEPADGELLDFVMHTDGAGGDSLKMIAGGSRHPTSAQTLALNQHVVFQDGRTVFKHAVGRMGDVVTELLVRNGLSSADVKLAIPHQANLRIIKSIAKRQGWSMDRIAVTIDRWANTTAATLPTTLDWAVEEGRLEHGDLVVFATFGAGFTWGAALMRW